MGCTSILWMSNFAISQILIFADAGGFIVFFHIFPIFNELV